MEYEKRKSKAKTPISFKNGNIADPGKELILKNAKNIDKPFFFFVRMLSFIRCEITPPVK